MNTADTERQVRALAGAADLPQGFDSWPGVLARLPRARRRRTVVRAATAAATVLAVSAAVAVALSAGAPQSAVAVARRAASAARTGAGLPAFELTEVIRTHPIGFQPEPPPPLAVQHIQYASPSRWRVDSTVTEPFGQGTQRVTQIRNGARVASVTAGQVTITRAASHGGLPFAALAGPGASLRKLLTAGSAGRCAPSVSLAGSGPPIDGRPTVVLRSGPSPCPSADVPQADGPATFWLDRQTYLILRAVLHGPANQLAQTITVTRLRYHVAFPAGTFRLPRPTPAGTSCRPPAPPVSLPDLAALRSALAYPPLLPARLPGGLRIGTIGSEGMTTGHCKLAEFTVTYLNRSGRPAVQLYEAPQASPAVRFPGRKISIRPGQAGTLSSGRGMTFLWWIQDGRYCALQSGGPTAGVQLAGVPDAVLVRMAASVRG